MKKETRREISLTIAMIAIAVAIIFAFVAGTFVGNNAVSEPENDRFMEGVMVGVDYAALNILHESGGISDEDYQELNEAIEAYIEYPSDENRENWYDLYQRKLMEMAQH